MNQGYPYVFSIIMSVYNVKPFIKEAVASIVHQDIGFEKIQIVFVDDGSTDGSEAICDEYKEKYPNNVVVVHQKNGGLSSARNEGLKHVTGNYVNFFDPDDKLSLNTCRKVQECFGKYGEQIDLVAIPLHFFEGAKGEHPTNYGKFGKEHNLINLEVQYDLLQTSCAASFIRIEAAKKLHFDEKLSAMEDAKALITLFLNKSKYGAAAGCKYHYRKRREGEKSLSQSASSQARWYIQHLNLFSYDVIKICYDKLGHVPKFAQYVIMYDLQWKYMQEHIPMGILSDSEVREYKEKLYGLLQYIEDEVILKQRSMFSEHRMFAFAKKYPDMTIEIDHNNNLFLANQSRKIEVQDTRITIEFIELTSTEIVMDINTREYKTLALNTNICDKLFVSVNGKKLACEKTERTLIRTIVDEEALIENGFRIALPLGEDEYEISFLRNINGKWVEKRCVEYGKFAVIGNTYRNSYYYKTPYLLMAKDNRVYLKKSKKFNGVLQEFRFLGELACSKEKTDKKAFCVRALHNVIKPFIRKPIWLISDKANRADDNGEAFFEFVVKNHSSDVNAYFVISEDSPDYERMKRIGKVVPTLSKKHKFLFTLASKSISAYTHIETNNPYRAYFEPYRDYLNHCNFVFLQHGITQNDVSAGLNKYNKNIACFITSAKPETDFICNSKFYYTKEQVALCGFPRYDRLYNEPKRIVTIAPTWRAKLFSGFIPEESRWIMKEGFEESDFYKFYSSLVNNERLLQAAEKYDYKIQYFPHSVFFPYIDKFKVDPRVTLCATSRPYRVMFAESDLLITDYSSVAFDFAYLRKPVVYSQFDYNDFFGGSQSYKPGYFSYEDNGFGEVRYDVEGTIDVIIEYMKNGCQLKDMYRERIEGFFAFSDRNNCKRVYDRIMKMEDAT